MGSNPILAAIDQRKRCPRSRPSRQRDRLFLPCFYRQRAGPPRTSPDEGGPESRSLLPSYDLVEVGAGAGQSFGHRVDVHPQRERTCGARKLGFAS